MSGAGWILPTRSWALAALMCLHGLCASQARSADLAIPVVVASLDMEPRQFAACSALAQAPWPSSSIERRILLQRFEAARPLCIRHAGLLAALGALWLEEGEPSQALIWLERALLLDPGSLGAQADHALALAALGEPAARNELAQAWHARTDVPPALRDKLIPRPLLTANTPLPPVRLGRMHESHWVSHIEATLLAGHETNLDHSPRLAEITLTPPGGPIDLPLENPLAPRRGAAILTDLSVQFARSAEQGQVWRAGISLGGREAPGDRKTDWRHLQFAASGSQQWGLWRGQFEVGSTWISGPLSEPYRLTRATALGERSALGCQFRLALEGEDRTQSLTSVSDGRTVGAYLSSQCPVSMARGWTWGGALRASVDRPADPARAGGTQRLLGVGGHLTGPLPAGFFMDASLRLSRVRDDDGYSPLLESDARRMLNQVQWSIELTKPVSVLAWSPLELIAQLQGIRQSSNLSVFRYSGLSAYSGLRWAW